MSRAGSAAVRAAQCLPLLGALALLPWLPALVEAPLSGVVVLPWRLDALTLVFVLSVAAGIAVVPLRPRETGVAVALSSVLAPALLLEHLLALPAALLPAALVLGSRRWLLASVLLGCALAWPYATAGAGWNDPLVAPAFATPVAALLLAAVVVAFCPWPLPQQRTALEPALLPIWLVPLLRAIGLQPWRQELGLLALAAGCAFALWSTVAALRAAGDRSAELVHGWLAFALAAAGLLSTVGTAAALYSLLAYPLGLGLLLRAPRLAAPLPLTAAFVAAWLVIGAVAAAGAWLAAAALLLATLGSGVGLVSAGLKPRAERTKPNELGCPSLLQRALYVQPGAAAPGLLAASWALGIGAAPVLEQLILPAVGLLQGGLTPFGLVAVWPWIGIAALDAGQRRVATLPAIAIVLLALILAGAVWIVARIRSRQPAFPSQVSQSSTLNSEFRTRVWWLGERPGE